MLIDGFLCGRHKFRLCNPVAGQGTWRLISGINVGFPKVVVVGQCRVDSGAGPAQCGTARLYCLHPPRRGDLLARSLRPRHPGASGLLREAHLHVYAVARVRNRGLGRQASADALKLRAARKPLPFLCTRVWILIECVPIWLTIRVLGPVSRRFVCLCTRCGRNFSPQLSLSRLTTVRGQSFL